jgi:hypothetical protein
MTNKQKIQAARKKLNNTFPLQLNVFFYKGLEITKEMFESEE